MARSQDRHNLYVGTGVLLGAILFVVGVFIYNQGSARWKDKTVITADFRQVSGLRVGSPVQLEGIQIGTVTDREFIDIAYPCGPGPLRPRPQRQLRRPDVLRPHEQVRRAAPLHLQQGALSAL